MTESPIACAISQISEMARIPLEVSEAPWAGSRFEAFRPVGAEERKSFSIILNRSTYRTRAVFVVDKFAGAMLRSIGMRGPEELQWAELAAEGKERGIDTLVAVDGSSVSNLRELDPHLWQSLEIECVVRRSPSVPAKDTTDLVSVGVQCLTMILVGLGIDEYNADPGLPEGAAYRSEVTRYERSRVNRLRCIRQYGATCWVCDFSFSEKYGSIGDGFIEVHHRVPVSLLPEDYKVNPVRDLIPLCSNCHSMAHQRTPVYQPDELRRMIGQPDKMLPAPSITLA